jgi:hypothetical protein
MSGSEWSKYLNGVTSQYNFSYKSNIPIAPPASITPAPSPSPISTPVPNPEPNITNKKNNNTKINNVKINNIKTNNIKMKNIKLNNKNKTLTGGKRKTKRRITKRKKLY